MKRGKLTKGVNGWKHEGRGKNVRRRIKRRTQKKERREIRKEIRDEENQF